MHYLLWHKAAASARLHGDRPAIRDGGTTLTHAELHVASDALAALLAREGLERGDRVGLWAPKQARGIVAMLAASKAGGVYVPVDPSAPVQRAAFILGDAGVRVLVTSRRLLESLEQQLGSIPTLRAIVVVDDDGALLQQAPVRRLGWGAAVRGEPAPPIAGCTDADPAYVLYTSGSTGTPKGVVISHRNALQFVDWAVDTFAVGPDDRMSNHAPFHFDLSVFDIYSALHTGGSVTIVPDRLAPFPVELAKWIEAQGITTWYSVPSALVRLLKHGHLERFAFPALRTILFAGEVFPVRHLAEVMQRFPTTRFYNLYGPTETNVCTWMEVPRPLDPEGPELSIGHACANFECFALTADGRRAAAGEEGELLARGPGVMLGYWNLPERTRQNLVQNPLHSAYADPVYRTGDIVRVREDGAYTFIGRRDHMVKTRGYRVELEEIEHVLHADERVRGAVVVAIPDEEFGARLRAAVMLEGDAALTAADLARLCAARLPSYAVPEHFAFLDELPRTSTGKVDRRALLDLLTPTPSLTHQA